MRAYAESRDPLRPTIFLQDIELAIGPAGLDIHGPWGIHVPEGPVNRAPDIQLQLEDAARRLAGSKGNPPRLVDENPAANGGGGPRIMPRRPDAQPPQVEHVVSVGAARVPQVPAPSYVMPAQAHQVAPANAAPANPELRMTPPPRARSRTRPPSSSVRTALGYTSGSGAQSAIVRLGLAPHISAGLGRLVDRVVPAEFHLESRERRVLNALGEGELTARGIGQMLDVADPVSFMEELTRKLESYDIDLVEPGEAQGGEPTYRMRR
jgi:hypothetical protein